MTRAAGTRTHKGTANWLGVARDDGVSEPGHDLRTEVSGRVSGVGGPGRGQEQARVSEARQGRAKGAEELRCVSLSALGETLRSGCLREGNGNFPRKKWEGRCGPSAAVWWLPGKAWRANQRAGRLSSFRLAGRLPLHAVASTRQRRWASLRSSSAHCHISRCGDDENPHTFPRRALDRVPYW